METTKKNYALPIAMMFALFFMIAFVTGLQNPMGVIIKSQFTLSNLQSQFGNLANFIAYAFMGIPAGLLLQKVGYKKTALTAIAVGFVGVAITFASSRIGGGKEVQNTVFAIYLIGALVSGFSMCMLNTVVNLCSTHSGAEVIREINLYSSEAYAIRLEPLSFPYLSDILWEILQRPIFPLQHQLSI